MKTGVSHTQANKIKLPRISAQKGKQIAEKKKKKKNRENYTQETTKQELFQSQETFKFSLNKMKEHTNLNKHIHRYKKSKIQETA